MWRTGALACLAVAIALLYFANQQRNPPGFAQDESSIAYNALQIAQHGVDEHGVAHPLYFKAFGEYKNPLYIYMLAGVFKVVAPSNLAARRLSAVLGLAAIFMLAWLAWTISRSIFVAVVTMLTAAATPSLFEISRLAFEVAAYPLALACFLLAAYTAFRRERWGAALVAALAASLIAMTYAYSIGRLHAPLLLALFMGLTLTRARIVPLAALVAAYVLLAVVPLVVFNVKNNHALTERFARLRYKPEHATEWISHTLQNLDPLHGDPNPRHHVPGSGGEVLLVTIILAAIGAVTRRDRWGWFVLGGTILSIVPAALTTDVRHALRLVPYPIFLLVLSIPVLQLLRARPPLAALLLALGVAQTAFFFHVFARDGAKRTNEFDAGFRQVLRGALDASPRPVVSHSVFMQAWWYGAQLGVERNGLEVTWDPASAPPGSVVVGDEQPCSGCDVIRREGRFTAWRVR